MHYLHGVTYKSHLRWILVMLGKVLDLHEWVRTHIYTPGYNAWVWDRWMCYMYPCAYVYMGRWIHECYVYTQVIHVHRHTHAYSHTYRWVWCTQGRDICTQVDEWEGWIQEYALWLGTACYLTAPYLNDTGDWRWFSLHVWVHAQVWCTGVCACVHWGLHVRVTWVWYETIWCYLPLFPRWKCVLGSIYPIFVFSLQHHIWAWMCVFPGSFMYVSHVCSCVGMSYVYLGRGLQGVDTWSCTCRYLGPSVCEMMWVWARVDVPCLDACLRWCYSLFLQGYSSNGMDLGTGTILGLIVFFNWCYSVF
jgi:hypothetical protein